MSTSIYDCCILQFLGNSHVVLPHQEYTHTADKTWKNQAKEGICQVHLLNSYIIGYDDDIRRNHHSHENKREKELLASELEEGEGICSEAHKEHLYDNRKDANDKTVLQIREDWHCIQNGPIVLESRIGCEQPWRKGRNLTFLLKTEENTHDYWCHEDNTQ